MWQFKSTEEVIGHFKVLWKEYALCPDEKLSADAIELKRKLLDSVGFNNHQDATRITELEEALKPFAEPHFMGDNYVKFSPRLIEVARKALTKSALPQKGE